MTLRHQGKRFLVICGQLDMFCDQSNIWIFGGWRHPPKSPPFASCAVNVFGMTCGFDARRPHQMCRLHVYCSKQSVWDTLVCGRNAARRVGAACGAGARVGDLRDPGRATTRPGPRTRQAHVFGKAWLPYGAMVSAGARVVRGVAAAHVLG